MNIMAYKPDIGQQYDDIFKECGIYPFNKIGRCVVDKDTGKIKRWCDDYDSNFEKYTNGIVPCQYYDDRLVRLIQAEEMKLVDYDKNSDMEILREGNKPLDEYIVEQDDWGTIYSDGTVEVAELAPTTVDDYHIALSCLEEIQTNNVELLTDEFQQFDFKNIKDHEELINNINDANIKVINQTKYPITVQNDDGSNYLIKKPVLKAGTIPTPINFACMITDSNEIYVGRSYENYGDNIDKFGSLTPTLISNNNGIMKYSFSGTVEDQWGNTLRIAQVENSSSDKNNTFTERCICKIRMKYKNNYVEKFNLGPIHSPAKTVKSSKKNLNDGWILFDYTCKYSPTDSNAVRALSITAQAVLLKGTVVKNGDLFVEIDTNSFLYTRGEDKLPYIPKGIIVPECNLSMKFENKQPLDYSYIIKSIDSVNYNANYEKFALLFGKQYVYESYSPTRFLYESFPKKINLNKDNNILTLISNTYKKAYFNNDNINIKVHKASGVLDNMLNFTPPTVGSNFTRHKFLKNILIYKGDLNQKELEKENSKAQMSLKRLINIDKNSEELMVYIPKFMCKREWNGDDIKDNIFPERPVAPMVYRDDFKFHPAFIREDGTIRNYILVGAVLATEIAGQLRSVPNGQKPLVNKNISEFRDLARQGRNNKFNIMSMETLSCLQLLYKIAFQDLDSQKMIGSGWTEKSESAPNASTMCLGNRSGYPKVNGDQISFLGIEDFYGNVWQFIDGIYIKDDGYYITNDVSKFGKASSTFDKISAVPLMGEEQNTNIEGCITKMTKIDGIHEYVNIPKELGGSVSTYYTDYFWSHKKGQENICRFGASWSYGSLSGAFALYLSCVPSAASSNLGSRLCIYP